MLEKIPRKFLLFENKKEIDKKIYNWLNKINVSFSDIIRTKAPQFAQYTPYQITVKELVAKNEYTKGTYVAINKNDGTLELFLNYNALKEFKKIPTDRMLWVFFHEFRHKIQMNDADIQSIINYPNWNNFNIFMQKKFKKDEDFINHIFHELNPSEVDANIFASEMTSVKFNGNVFDINDKSLTLLTKKK